MRNEPRDNFEPVDVDEKVLDTMLAPGDKYVLQVRDENNRLLIEWSLTDNLKPGFVKLYIKVASVEKPEDHTAVWGSASCEVENENHSKKKKGRTQI